MEQPKILATNQIDLRGTAVDNYEVRRVAIIIKNSTGQYLHPDGWTSERARIYVPVNSADEWNWRSPVLPKDEYTIRAMAQDSTNRWDSNPARFNIVIE